MMNSASPTLFDAFESARQTLDKNVGQLYEQYGSMMECRKGCNQCCIDNFNIRYIEAVIVLMAVTSLPPETVSPILANLQDPNRTQCPLLIDGGCSIYESRPFMCRAFGLVLKHGERYGACELNKEQFQALPSVNVLDMPPYYDVLDTLSNRLWAASPMQSLPPSDEAPKHSIKHWLLALFQLPIVTTDMGLPTVNFHDPTPTEAFPESAIDRASVGQVLEADLSGAEQ